MGSGVGRSLARRSVIWGTVLLATAAAALAVARPAHAWTAPAQASFADVLPTTAFYTYIEALNAAGIMSGYGCGGAGEPCDALNRPYFRQYNDVTRGQAAKAIALAANAVLANPPAQGSFADVLPGNPYYAAVEGLAAKGAVNGYSCGGPSEPCDAFSRPYFRPYFSVTRGQLARMVALAAGANLGNPPAQPSFADVLPGNPFFAAVEVLSAGGSVSGYACGGPGEPCDALNHPYFRPYANVTRAQTAKIVALALVFSDTTAPTISAPAQTVEATGPAGAAVAYGVTAADPDDPDKAITCTPASGSTFPLGATTVTCTAEDTHLNMATATFAVTVQDGTAPAFAGLPSSLSADATSPSGATVAYAQPTANDLVDGAVAVKCAPSSRSLFPIGATTVKCTAVDVHGNAATASFKVTVNGASAQIDALIKKLAGSSLTKPLYTAKAYLTTPDLEGACAELAEFESEVRAA